MVGVTGNKFQVASCGVFIFKKMESKGFGSLALQSPILISEILAVPQITEKSSAD
jgi:hypothetical protein